MTTRTCPRCGDSIQFLDQQCAGCGADISIELEIAAFHQPAIDSARKMILWAGTFYLLLPILMFAMLARLAGGSVFASTAFLVTFGVGAAIFAGHVGLWWWARRSPLPATLIAFAVFLGYVVITGVADGFVLKLVGFVVLGRAVLASNRVRKLRVGGGGAAMAALALLVIAG